MRPFAIILIFLAPSFTHSFCVSPDSRSIHSFRNVNRQKASILGSVLDESNEESLENDSSKDQELTASDGSTISDSSQEDLATSEDKEVDSFSQVTSGTDKSQLLKKLLIIASASDRGQFASVDQKSVIKSVIDELESSNLSMKEPTLSTSIEGTWELLYSDTQLFRSSPFFMAGRAVCQTEEEAQKYDWFCDMHRAALAISNIGKVRQIITPERLISEFEVKVGSVPFLSDYTPFKYSGGLPFTIDGAIVSSADITPTTDGKAWEIYMDTVEIKGSNIPLLRQILDSGRVKLSSRDLAGFLEENVSGYSTPRPIFDTIYLDEMIRISKDQDGKVFVYGKVSDNTEVTSYKSVDSDLGVAKLLEGLNDNFLKFYI